MSGQIQVQYEAVYSKTAELRQRIAAELQEMDETYRQTHSSLHRMDSRTNAVFMETMALNQQKAQVTAETLTKLLTFIEAATRQVERDEQMIKRVFTLSKVRTSGDGGTS